LAAKGSSLEDRLNHLPRNTGRAIRARAGQFERGGTDDLENPHIFQTPEVRAAGALAVFAA
jgi:hypothetical protein